MLEMHGSWRARRNKAEPQPEPGRPVCPEWLDPEAKRAWDSLVPQLELMQVLTRIDGNALTRYCQLWSRWIRAEQFLQKYGDTYPLKDDKGNVRCFMPWPQVAIANKLSQSLTRLEQEFGLTPSSRTRIRIDATHLSGSGLDDEARAFFAGGGPVPPRVPQARPRTVAG